jgi:hypothetical protein
LPAWFRGQTWIEPDLSHPSRATVTGSSRILGGEACDWVSALIEFLPWIFSGAEIKLNPAPPNFVSSRA